MMPDSRGKPDSILYPRQRDPYEKVPHFSSSIVFPDSAGLAAAQPLPPGLERLQTVMRTLDADNDQTLSTDEVQAAAQRLLSLDSDGDGALSLEELGGPAPIRGMIRQQYVPSRTG